MSDAAQKLLEQIRALPEDDRRWLAEELWDEQEGVSDEDVDALHADPEFQAMLADRLRQVEEHPERLIDGPEAMRMIREHLAAKSGEPATRTTGSSLLPFWTCKTTPSNTTCGRPGWVTSLPIGWRSSRLP